MQIIYYINNAIQHLFTGFFVFCYRLFRQWTVLNHTIELKLGQKENNTFVQHKKHWANKMNVGFYLQSVHLFFSYLSLISCRTLQIVLSIMVSFKYKFWLGFFLTFMLAGCAVEGLQKHDNFEQRNIELAYRFLAHGYPQKAIKRLKKILKSSPESVLALNMLATVYREQGEYVLAEQNYQKALSLTPTATKVRNNYGVLLARIGQYEAAYEQFKQVTEDVYYENRSEAFDNMGVVALKLTKSKEAESHFRRAVRLNPQMARPHLELSKLFYEEENYLDAQYHFDQFKKLAGKHYPDSLLVGIKLAHALGDWEAEARYVKELFQSYPDSSEYRAYRVLLND